MGRNDSFVCLVGIAAGLIGVGYALGTKSKMAKISERLDRSIDELAGNTTVDIPHDMVQRAVEKAVAEQVKQCVSKATDEVIVDVKRDVHKRVSDAVENEYSDIKSTVLKELTEEAAKIDAARVRGDVERAAKEHALKKFDADLGDILNNYNEQLKNTGRIYTSIADAMTGYRPAGKETVLRIG